ncbi:hypothetical protein AK812_SmicGene10325 [Symbiodinium microadriaticum]|uniref:Uncharacterized protein n=1 Tax=Symbiodinium microadriaticum TaxID=2951 RepID=A0A1Q9EG09_SYMMI|nr:hypothetical protein AK812_SmicGene10325 [Symbiodinium microadriaticum]
MSPDDMDLVHKAVVIESVMLRIMYTVVSVSAQLYLSEAAQAFQSRLAGATREFDPDVHKGTKGETLKGPLTTQYWVMGQVVKTSQVHKAVVIESVMLRIMYTVVSVSAQLYLSEAAQAAAQPAAVDDLTPGEQNRLLPK